jgi:arsenate reductase
MTTTIWHNPRCSKSRQTLALLEERGISPDVRLYLDDAPSTTEVAEVLNQLGIAPWELLRRGEKAFKELGLDKNSVDQELIEAMSANPILIERPIVIHGGGAALGRPPESVLGLFD